MSTNRNNSKRIRTLTVDNLMPNSMNMGLKNATYDKIIRVRTLHVPIFLLIEPLTVISKQQNLPVRFLKKGMLISPAVHTELIKFLINSVKYN